jgi:Skp family chaperone for outer membrane proteins
MRKHFLLLIFISVATITATAQTGRGIRIGYIDMEYILQNVPDYIEAKNQLELKAQKWKQDAEVKKNEITKLKESLKTERALLTKELIEEREEEITFLETELSDFQQKKFGPAGELIVQKAVLVKPIQDQVFTAVQDIAELKRYDFVFDKSSDLTMIFAAKKYDISDLVVRTLTRSSKRNQLSKKELKEEDAKEYQENLQDENPAMAERQKKLDDRKAAREKLIADKKAAAEERKAAAVAKRQQLLDEKEAKKNGTTMPAKEGEKAGEKPSSTTAKDSITGQMAKPAVSTAKDSIANEKEMVKKAAADAKAKTLEDRRKALADKKAKVIADREAAKKAKEEKAKQDKEAKENKND